MTDQDIAGIVHQGDALSVLASLPEAICRTAVTSPPYWGLRDYGNPDQLGSEASVDDYVHALVVIFRELSRVLTPDGTLWLNIGDCYTSGDRTWRAPDRKNPARAMSYRAPTPVGLKPKELVGVPWRVASALQMDGWYLRSEIIWHKPNVHPESVKDRPTRAHEHVFMLTRSEHYYYDQQAVREPGAEEKLRNRRSVWTIPTQAFRGAHFATFPPALIEPCVLAGSAPGDVVLDPFFGAGTTGLVAARCDRHFLGIEIVPAYVDLARTRLAEEGIHIHVRKAERPPARPAASASAHTADWIR